MSTKSQALEKLKEQMYEHMASAKGRYEEFSKKENVPSEETVRRLLGLESKDGETQEKTEESEKTEKTENAEGNDRQQSPQQVFAEKLTASRNQPNLALTKDKSFCRFRYIRLRSKEIVNTGFFNGPVFFSSHTPSPPVLILS